MSRRIVMEKTVFTSTPIVEDGKPVMVETTFKNRKITVAAHEPVRLVADQAMTVSDAYAKELVKAGQARYADPLLDGDDDDPLA